MNYHKSDCKVATGALVICPTCRASGRHTESCDFRHITMITPCCKEVIAHGWPLKRPGTTTMTETAWQDLRARTWEEGRRSCTIDENPYRQPAKTIVLTLRELEGAKAEAWEDAVKRWSYRQDCKTQYVVGSPRDPSILALVLANQNPYRNG